MRLILMALQKATIEILDDDAVAPDRGLDRIIEVQFNPTEYGLSKAAQIAQVSIPGIDSPILQFVRGQVEKLSLELFYDTTAEGMGEKARDVRERTRSIYQLVKIQPKTHAPPRVRFTWGQGLSFKAIVDSVNQKFTLFSPLGVPLRATVTVSFLEYKTLEEQVAELKLESADHTKNRVVRRSDTISGIAAQEYGDPRLWRTIADHPPNDRALTRLRLLRPGTRLEIPPIEP